MVQVVPALKLGSFFKLDSFDILVSSNCGDRFVITFTTQTFDTVKSGAKLNQPRVVLWKPQPYTSRHRPNNF